MLEFELGVKTKKQKLMEQAKNKALKDIKQMQNKFIEKKFGIPAPAPVEEEKKNI